MSMLAEPRRKQKIINLRAKNNAWSNDSTKFGQRMLEKMGWTSGKGLGAKENGIVEHVVARYKNDERGLGYEDKNDQWTKHEDDFNALLANLSNEKDTSAEVLHSGVSLEVKSKKSKARIHYHKFTRGKDISRYSEKDLANIFGKKSFKNEVVEETVQEDLKQSEQVFTEKGSMEDYFKSKMAALKSKNKINISNNENSSDNCDFAFRGFSCPANDDEISAPPPNEETKSQKSLYSMFIQSNVVDDNQDEKLSKKNKKKKSKNKDVLSDENNEPDYAFQGFSNSNVDNITNDNQELKESEETLIVKKNKKKKKKAEYVEENIQEVMGNNLIDNENVEVKKSKKKKKKNNEEDMVLEDEISGKNEESIMEEDYVPKKKKKRKNKDL